MNELKTNGGFALSQGVMDALRENFDSGRVSEAETSAEITTVWPRMPSFCVRTAQSEPMLRTACVMRIRHDHIGHGASCEIP